jgi:hypothetical protein
VVTTPQREEFCGLGMPGFSLRAGARLEKLALAERSEDGGANWIPARAGMTRKIREQKEPR